MPKPGAGGAEHYNQTTAPLTPAPGDTWFDGTDLQLYTNTGWVIPGGQKDISARVSVLSQAVSVISQQVSVLSQAHSVLSQAFSAVSAGLGTVQLKVAGDAQVISGTTTTKISGLSASVTSAAIYQIDGNVLFNMSAVDTALFNVSGPASTSVRLRWEIGKDQSSQVVQFVQTFGDNASATISTTSAYTAKLEGVIVTGATAGTVQLYAFASVAAKDINIKKGSYLRAYKIG